MSPTAYQSIERVFAGASGWVGGLPDWQAVLVLVGGSMVAAAIVQVGGDAILRRLTARIDGDVDDVVFGYLHRALWISLLVAGPSLGLGRLGALGGLSEPLGAGALSFVVLVWAYALIRIGPPIFAAVTDTTSLERQVVPIFQNVWTVATGGGAVLVGLAIWEVDVTPLLASAGVLGIVVGLAARDTIANFFGSLALYADGTYAVGDYVVLESGERGRVEDVTVRSTIIPTRDDVLVTVPNAQLNNGAVVNESTPRRHRRVRVPVSVAYGTDIDAVEDVMLAIAESEPLIRERPSPRVRLREFGDSGLHVELLCWIEDPRFRGRARDALMREVYREFRASGVEIPYPQRELRVRENGTGATGVSAAADGVVPGPVAGGDGDGGHREQPGDDGGSKAS